MTTPHNGAASALDELRAAYHEQLNRLAAERDEARRNARRAQAQADVARADLASLKSRVAELLNAASRHLPDLEPPEAPPAGPAALPAPGAAARDDARPDGPAGGTGEGPADDTAGEVPTVEGRVVQAPDFPSVRPRGGRPKRRRIGTA
ncbi:hypothetical protein [Actinomadura sp. WAC 06369]|uniref:hypothetical protein n=1 Tax=Actinomadura sp. WAC 06369 TaxID=2203193 RepID=UPI000F77D0E8|nr:hypothetical protein [Actinomadura sp. WAC 06369]RSN67931.1 hypothetical protein DMH08_12045 [Actinomadura sp. WAC 06369]